MRPLALPVVAALALAACTSGAAPASTTPASSAPASSTSRRVIEIEATDNLKFEPAQVAIKVGETVIFRVKNSGAIPHKFMVGPKQAVDAASAEGTAELEDIQGGQTKDLEFTFANAGTFEFACHVPGHFEAGMVGTVTLTQ